jgi:PleD family two-component response regulator
MLTSEDFDLSIVDLSMPRLDGFRLLALIRATPKLTYHPLLVATSRKDVKAIDEAFALGANAFQTKPMDWATLPAQLRHDCHVSDDRRSAEAAGELPEAGRAALLDRGVTRLSAV